MKNIIINFIQYFIIWSTLFGESFKALSFSDSKDFDERVSNCDSFEELQLLKGEIREYVGMSLAAFMMSLFLTVTSIIVLFIYMNLFSLLAFISFFSLSSFFFRHWQNGNGLCSACIDLGMFKFSKN